ncbi:hydrolase [Polyangium aurulentum]|uniref:hydrolase n=1 Tax=Polyangium aurulentum TaxID=2567896 RepID=UPI0010AE8CED|nr:hydrolase [Polyangium aurulentum]UQA59175.1 hydrolase [Polyangium aurulentum]
MTTKNDKVGLDALLTPDNCALMLIDHQPFQISGVQNVDPLIMLNNTVFLAKTAKAFGVPTLLTTVIEERGGYLYKPLQDVFPEQKPINRTTINTWEDQRCVEWAKKTGRKKLVMAGLFTEICLAFPVIHALGDGYEVYAVTDASGGISKEAHEVAIHRMVQAGAVPLTTAVFLAELQRDWAREATVPRVAELFLAHAGHVGTNYAWEMQLLGTRNAPPGV